MCGFYARLTWRTSLPKGRMDTKREGGEHMAYRIVGELEGTEIKFTGLLPGRQKEEETYETVEEAEAALKDLEQLLPEGTKLTIEPAV